MNDREFNTKRGRENNKITPYKRRKSISGPTLTDTSAYTNIELKRRSSVPSTHPVNVSKTDFFPSRSERRKSLDVPPYHITELINEDLAIDNPSENLSEPPKLKQTRFVSPRLTPSQEIEAQTLFVPSVSEDEFFPNTFMPTDYQSVEHYNEMTENRLAAFSAAFNQSKQENKIEDNFDIIIPSQSEYAIDLSDQIVIPQQSNRRRRGGIDFTPILQTSHNEYIPNLPRHEYIPNLPRRDAIDFSYPMNELTSSLTKKVEDVVSSKSTLECYLQTLYPNFEQMTYIPLSPDLKEYINQRDQYRMEKNLPPYTYSNGEHFYTKDEKGEYKSNLQISGAMSVFPLFDPNEKALYQSKYFSSIANDLKKVTSENPIPPSPSVPKKFGIGYALYLLVLIKKDDEYFIQPRIIPKAVDSGHPTMLFKSEQYQMIPAKELEGSSAKMEMNDNIENNGAGIVVGGGEFYPNKYGKIVLVNDRTGCYNKSIKAMNIDYVKIMESIFGKVYDPDIEDVFYKMGTHSLNSDEIEILEKKYGSFYKDFLLYLELEKRDVPPEFWPKIGALASELEAAKQRYALKQTTVDQPEMGEKTNDLKGKIQNSLQRMQKLSETTSNTTQSVVMHATLYSGTDVNSQEKNNSAPMLQSSNSVEPETTLLKEQKKP